MKKTRFFILAILTCLLANKAFPQIDSSQILIDQIERSLYYQTGIIELPKYNAVIQVPEGFRYLNTPQSRYVLSKLWANPEDTTILGLLVPENIGVLDPDVWVFTISFEKIGYVQDRDAENIDYNELLQQLKKETSRDNPEREKLGFQSVELINWASAPFYDKEKKVLHWAKLLRFGQDSVGTLNYNLRILGKDGIFVFNAVSPMSQQNQVEPSIDKVLASIKFDKGSTYFDFNPDKDKVAAWSVRGLVSGKMLAKTGFFTELAKVYTVIIGVILAMAAACWSYFKWKKSKALPTTTK